VLDFETTNLQKGSALDINNSIVLACWRIVDPAGGRTCDKHKFGDEYNQQELLDDIAKADFIVAHHLKVELQWLRRCGADLTKIKGFCTMLGKWVLNGNLQKPLSLVGICEEYGVPQTKDAYISTLMKLGVCPSEMPPDKLHKYCAIDVNLCHWIFRIILKKLIDNHQLHLALTRNLTATVLADIEFNGMTLDKAKVLAEYDKAIQEKHQLSQDLATLAPGVNLGSPKQLGEFLYDKLGFKVPVDHKGKPLTTASGKRPTGTEVVGSLTGTTPDQKRFLELYKRFNKVDSLLSKNLEFFRLVCLHNKDQTFHAQFNQGITKTHRLSSSGRPITFPGEKKPKSVQFQNLPRQYKSLFCAGPDEEIGEADGAALEFRIATDLGNDPTGSLDHRLYAHP
jgi:DNA polymerase I-like protein with 3'-5' exonuclease and polymerase domains